MQISQRLKYWLYIGVLITYCTTNVYAFQSKPLLPGSKTKIRIASEPDYPPYCFVDVNGEPRGFSIDLIKEAAKAIGLELDIKIGVWNIIKRDLAEGKIDALPFVGRTPEREELYDFTFSYLSLHGAVFVRKGTTGINSINDLKNKVIAVMKGDNAEEFIRRQNVSEKIYTTNTFGEAFHRLAAGEFDAVITQRIMGINLLEEMKLSDNIIPLNIQLPEFRQDFCFAVTKGNKDLLLLLNEGLSIVIANNKYDEIHNKWFGPAIKEELSFNDIMKIILFTLIPLVIIMTISFVVFLKREIRKRTRSLKSEIAEHKKTVEHLHEQQLKLKQSEEIFRRLFEEHTAVKLLIDPVTLDIIDANNAASKFYGWPKEELKKMKISQINLLPHNKVISEIEKVSNNSKDHFEFQHLLADGSTRYVEVYSSNITIGEKEFIHSIVVDITSRKTAEKSISKNTERLNGLLNIYQYNSRNIQDFLDYSLNEAIKLTSSKIGYIYFYNEEKKEFILNSWSKEVMEECKVMEIQTCYELEKTGLWGEAVRQRKEIIVNDFSETNHLKKGYPEGHVHLKKYLTLPVFDGEEIIAVVGVANKESDYDNSDLLQLRLMMNGVWRIVKRKEAEEKIKTLIKAVEQNPISVVITNSNGEIEFVNPKFTEVTGYSYDEAVNQNMRIIKSGEQDEIFYKDLWNTILNGNNWSGVFQNKKKNGELFWESAIISPIKNESDEVTHFVAVKEDITLKVEQENELKKYREHLEALVETRTEELKLEIKKKEEVEKQLRVSLNKEKELNELKSRFITTASHEFRTPLTIILTYAELLQKFGKKYDDEKYNNLFTQITGSVGKITHLLEDVLIINRADANSIRFEPMAVDFKKFCLNFLDDMKSSYSGKHKIKLDYNCSENIFYLDLKQMFSILQNLISNAYKFSPQGGSINVDIKNDDNYLYISVKDDGIGIPEKDIPKIFDRFHRGENIETIEGTGLGLSVVKTYVESHRGKIEVESKIGIGTTVKIKIPKNFHKA